MIAFDIVATMGENTLMAKTDIEKSFRILKLDKTAYKFMGCKSPRGELICISVAISDRLCLIFLIKLLIHTTLYTILQS